MLLYCKLNTFKGFQKRITNFHNSAFLQYPRGKNIHVSGKQFLNRFYDIFWQNVKFRSVFPKPKGIEEV